MPEKYKSAGKKIQGKVLGRLRVTICNLYPSPEELQQFLAENYEMHRVHSVAWNNSLSQIAFQLLRHAEAECWIYDLIAKLEEAQPDEEALQQLITDLLDGDYMQLNEPVELSKLDAFERFGTDCYTISGSEESCAAMLATSFGSGQSLKNFYISYFGHRPQSKHLRSQFDWTAPVQETLQQMLTEFDRLQYSKAFIGAVQDYDGSNMHAAALLASLLQEPKEEEKPESRETEPFEAPQAEKKLAIGPLPLTAAIKDRLCDLLVNMFDSSSLDMLCSSKLNQRISNITPDDTTRKMVIRVVDWCIENGQLSDLIAGAQKERPRRDDFQAFVRSLVKDGFLQYN